MIRERSQQGKHPKALLTAFPTTTTFYSDDQQPLEEDIPEGGPPASSSVDRRLMEEDLGDANFELDASDWSWDLAEIDDDGTLLQDPNGRELLPDPEREASEDEAFEIVYFAATHRNTRKGLRIAPNRSQLL